ncbi:hypothetical protein [Trinickia mobilis]|uniref:hypothetical protein n=1 Tax=Trinickia mobilis TaxID=2816356 RepID=UPI001A8CE6C6|nr:hypothetical protein [Trinickia mobilis]
MNGYKPVIFLEEAGVPYGLSSLFECLARRIRIRIDVVVAGIHLPIVDMKRSGFRNDVM